MPLPTPTRGVDGAFGRERQLTLLMAAPHNSFVRCDVEAKAKEQQVCMCDARDPQGRNADRDADEALHARETSQHGDADRADAL